MGRRASRPAAQGDQLVNEAETLRAARAGQAGGWVQAALVFLSCSALLVLVEGLLFLLQRRLGVRDVLPPAVMLVLPAGVLTAALVVAVRRLAGRRLQWSQARWNAAQILLLVGVCLPFWTARRGWTGASGWAAVCAAGALVGCLWLLSAPGRERIAAALAPAAFIGMQFAHLGGRLWPYRSHAMVLAGAGACAAVAWWLLWRGIPALSRVRWRPGTQAAVLAAVLAACWAAAPGGAEGASRVWVSPELRLATAGGVTRRYDSLLKAEAPLYHWELDSVPRGAHYEVSFFATGSNDGEDVVRCTVVFQSSDGGSEVLWETDLHLPMDGWTGRVVSLEPYAGKAGAVTVSAASASGSPYYVFCSVVPCQERRAGQYNVLLISLDGVRADRLGCYGYAQAATPRIDRLSAEGVRLADCVSQAPWSLPATFAMLTGEFPTAVWAEQPLSAEPRHFAGSLATLPEMLRRRGFVTAAVTDGGLLRPQSGLYQGFNAYTVTDSPGAEKTFGRAAAWLQEHRRHRFFLFVQTTVALAPQDKKLAPAAYDAGVGQADALVGMLLDELERLDVKDNTLVVVTSAHGQDLARAGEASGRPWCGYGDTLRQGALHVPLVMRAPGLVPAGRTVGERVSAVDVAPTVLGLLGIEPPKALPSVDLAPLMTGAGEPTGSRFAFSECTTWGPEQKALIGGRYKLVFVPEPWSTLTGRDKRQRTPASGPGGLTLDLPQLRLYDLDSDPAETRDVARSHPDVVGSYRTALESILRRNELIRQRSASSVVGAPEAK